MNFVPTAIASERASNPGPRKAWTLSTTCTLVALGVRAIQTLEQVLCLSQIGIEFQHAQDIVARKIDLPRTAEHPRDIHSNAALARGALEGVLPKPDGFAQMSTPGFDYREIRRGIDRGGIRGESFPIQLTGTIGLPFSLRRIPHRGKQGRIVRRFLDRHTKKLFGFWRSGGHAFID